MISEKLQNDIAMAERAWERAAKKFKDGDIRLAEPLYQLGHIYLSVGRRSEALPMLQRCLAICDDSGKSQPSLLHKVLDRLAVALSMDGRYTEALPLFQRALELREALFGPEHIETLWVLNNMGTACRSLNQLARSEEMLKRALAAAQKLPAAKKRLLPMLHTNLSGIYHDLQLYGPALEHSRKAIELEVAQLGPDSVRLAPRLNNMGCLLMESGDVDAAEEYLVRAHQLRIKKFGLYHPDMVPSLVNLGDFYTRKGDYDRAEQHLFQAASVCEKTLSPDDPDNAKIQLLLGNCYAAKGLEETAERCYDQAMAIVIKALGPEHPEVASVYITLGLLRQRSDLWEASLEPLGTALAIYEKAVRPEDRRIGQTLELLAKAHQALGNNKQAEECRGRAEAIREKGQKQ